MDVPKKIRLLNRVRKLFPAWAIERQAVVIENAFEADLKAVKADDWEAKQSILAQRDFEASEYWDELAQFRSRKLVKRAQRFYVPLDGLKWVDGNYGAHYLDNPSQTQLYRAIREEARKGWEFRIKVIGALTGLVGTIIGLVAILKK